MNDQVAIARFGGLLCAAVAAIFIGGCTAEVEDAEEEPAGHEGAAIAPAQAPAASSSPVLARPGSGAPHHAGTPRRERGPVPGEPPVGPWRGFGKPVR